MSLDRRFFLGGVAATVVSLPAHAASTNVPAAATEKVVEDAWTILQAQPASLRLAPEPSSETAVWGYNGQVPGPLLRIKKGAELKVRLVNKLAQPTSLCWHGVRAPNPV